MRWSKLIGVCERVFYLCQLMLAIVAEAGSLQTGVLKTTQQSIGQILVGRFKGQGIGDLGHTPHQVTRECVGITEWVYCALDRAVRLIGSKQWIANCQPTPPEYDGPERVINYLSNYVQGNVISAGSHHRSEPSALAAGFEVFVVQG